jgi:hypothetical protein
MRLSFDNYMTIAKVGAIALIGLYVWQKGKGAIDSLANFHPIDAVYDNVIAPIGQAAVGATGTATDPGALNVGNTIDQYLYMNGPDPAQNLNQDQATMIELAALGSMGA